MNIPQISVKRRITVIMLTLIVVIMGVVSLGRLPIDLLPDIEIPVAVVSTTYGGVGPNEVENIITRPIEQAVATVENIDKINSISSEGNSIVITQFNFGTDMETATLEMREKIDMVKGFLPDDVSNPMVLKLDINAQPIIQVSVSGSEDLARLQTLSEESIKPRLERLQGVASVDVSGGYTKQVEVKISQEKMKGYAITNEYISRIIAAENLNLPVGEVKKGNFELTARTVGEFGSLDEIKRLPITLPTGGVVNLEDIADVEMKYNELNSISKTNGNESINISIQKQSGTNTVVVADLVNKEIEKIRNDFEGLNINTIFDQSIYIKESIGTVFKNALLGALLAILILFIFLRNIRTTFIIGTAIPVSVIATFNLIYFSGITINMMTLGGLALGIGMLVDNAIVVLENIYRLRLEGLSRAEAAVKGATEVGMAITASTLTTVAVFIPIVFIQGMTAIIFKELALTVVMSLGASLIVALTLVPMLSSVLLKVNGDECRKRKGIRRIWKLVYLAFDKVLNGIQGGYKKLLGWSLGHRKMTVLAAILTFIISVVSLAGVGAEYFPSTDEGMFSINVSLPEGSKLEDTEGILMEIQDKLEGIEEIDTVFSQTGSGGMMLTGGSSSNTGSITVTLVSMDKRKRSTQEISDQVRELITDIPGAEKSVSVIGTISFGAMSPISISLKGDDLEVLKQLGDDVKEIIESVQGTREVENSMAEGIPGVLIKLKRENAARFGLTAGQVAAAAKGMVAGNTATRFKFGGEEIDVVVIGDSVYSESIVNIEQIPIQTPAGTTVTLGQVADVTIERNPISITREGQVRSITVNAQFVDRDLGSIVNDIEGKLKEYNMPSGYEYKIGGENEEMQNAFKDLTLALGLAVILVYMILASQFESLLYPLIIMLVVPLGFSGGALGLFVTRKPLSVVAFAGLIMLAGIVVNNSIVMVDYINTRRRHGENMKVAIMNAGPIRLRPILMTTLTTVLGMFPLALGIGEGAELESPLGVVVIGGLMLSTLLTLVFIPVMYTIMDDFSRLVKRKVFKIKETVSEQF